MPDAHDPSKRHAPMMLTTDLALQARPDLRADLEALPREPRPARRRLRQGLVQAAAPRHGPGVALPRPVGPRAAAVAGPGPRGRPRPDRRRRTSPPSRRKILDSGLSISAAGLHRLGVGVELPRHRQAGRGQRGPHPPRAAEGLGGQRAGRAGQGAADPRGDPAGLQRLAVRRDEGLARRPDRPRRVRGRRAGGEGRRATTSRSRSRRGAPTPRRSRPTSRRSRCSSRAPTGSATTSGPATKLPPETLLLDRANLLTLTAPEMTVLVGGMRALNANVGRSAARRLHRPARDADQRLLREPARHGHGVEGVDSDGERLRGPRPCDRRGQVDRPPPSTSSSARTRSSGPSPRSTRADDAKEKFVRDFVAAWDKVMNLDRFDLA